MYIFKIIRQFDVNETSGVGRVLDGVVFDDGTTVVRWRTAIPSTAIYKTFAEFKAIHIDSHPENETIIMKHKVDMETIEAHSGTEIIYPPNYFTKACEK